MSRARETGFYFEPVTERLALVIEGAPFPSGEHWAHVGDPIEMTPEQARLHVSMRWPGIDPEALNVELDLGMHQLLAELEAQHAAESAAADALPKPAEADVQALLAQAEELQRAVSELHLEPITRERLEAEAEKAERAREADASGAEPKKS